MFLNQYFSIKDVLITSDVGTAVADATSMSTAIKTVDMVKLSTKEHNLWMEVTKDLTGNAEAISKSKNLIKQREGFTLLSKNMYELAKVSKQVIPIYFQRCPMFNNEKGATWLSEDPPSKPL